MDEEIFNIADDIEFNDHMERLALELEFSSADANRFSATNRLTGRETTRGTRDMFIAWRQTVPQDSQRALLKAALLRANLVMLADKYFPDTIIRRENFSR